VKKDFKEWNATMLGVDVSIYEVEVRRDIVLIKRENKYSPYLKYVEG
jgi:hypothetical protein